MSTPEVLVQHDRDALAASVAARLVTVIVEAQSDRGHVHLCLAGGGIITRCLSALRASPACDSVDWSSVHVWWADERFLPEGDAERNETSARLALLDSVPLDPAHVHPMPAEDGRRGVDEAASHYSQTLLRESRQDDHAAVPSFDFTLLGICEDAHVASLFPQSPAVHEAERWVVGVHGAPKPPAARISLTLRALAASQEIWLIASGAAKADAVRLALSPAGSVQVPAAGARGRERTLLLLDADAASALPAEMGRPASP